MPEIYSHKLSNSHMSYLPLHDICIHFFYHILLRQVFLAITQNSGEDHYS